jgi:hypothetical protein
VRPDKTQERLIRVVAAQVAIGGKNQRSIQSTLFWYRDKLKTAVAEERTLEAM